MKRIDIIYNYILSKSKSLKKEELIEVIGFSAQEIEEATGILRSNVSRELNVLCRNKRVIKIKNRPVLYFDKDEFERILDIKLKEDIEEIDDISKIFDEISECANEYSPFNKLIGANTSLKNQIEQAKAALLYPPNGLHTLIIGSTGVGKSLFANMMYKYYKQIKKSKIDIPFIIFNCADYYNNPQLLLSYIFGHIKGAFTGADREKEGIIEKADGGILFLDEIHRLPPEGQEMVFYFMDTGTYNKLGETERNRKANVLLVGATTEDPNSTLLNTFIRRIPITIAIPDFHERTIEDKLELTNYLLSKESQRVNKPIIISGDAIKSLIGSTTYGNVGQLKSNIQLVCAKGFLASVNENKPIKIKFDLLPDAIKEGLINFNSKIRENNEERDIIPESITIQPDGEKIFLETEAYETSNNIYTIIEDKMSLLLEKGMNNEEINKFITKDINSYLKKFYDRFENDFHRREGLLKIVDKEIIEFAEKMKTLAESRLDRKLSERFIYGFSLHFSALFNRTKNNKNLPTRQIKLPVCINALEYKVAKEIYEHIKIEFNLNISPAEVEYLVLLLNSIQEPFTHERVGIVVAAHGSSTATSMVGFVKKMFEVENIVAVDMPFESSPSQILELTISKVIQVNQGKGVLLLVDMGSLNSFADTIRARTGIEVQSIDMVSTPIVLEAVRKCSFYDNDLKSVSKYLRADFRGYTKGIDSIDRDFNKEKVIITVCSTGKGAAEKLKVLVEKIIEKLDYENIKVIPVSIGNLNEEIKKVSEEKKILALVGITNKNNNDIPFISIEKLVDGTGEIIIRNIIEENYGIIESNEKEDNLDLEKICKETLDEFTTFLNSGKVYPLLVEFVDTIEEKLNINYEIPTKLRLMIHVACALERALLGNALNYDSDTSIMDERVFSIVKEASSIFYNTISIMLSDDEIYYIIDIINSFVK